MALAENHGVLNLEELEALDLRRPAILLLWKRFFCFLFENKDDKDLVFRSGPYFMGLRGLYLNRWSLSFDPEKGVPSAMLV